MSFVIGGGAPPHNSNQDSFNLESILQFVHTAQHNPNVRFNSMTFTKGVTVGGNSMVAGSYRNIVINGSEVDGGFITETIDEADEALGKKHNKVVVDAPAVFSGNELLTCQAQVFQFSDGDQSAENEGVAATEPEVSGVPQKTLPESSLGDQSAQEESTVAATEPQVVSGVPQATLSKSGLADQSAQEQSVEATEPEVVSSTPQTTLLDHNRLTASVPSDMATHVPTV